MFGAYWLNAKSFKVLQAKRKKLGAEISPFHRQQCLTHSYSSRARHLARLCERKLYEGLWWPVSCRCSAACFLMAMACTVIRPFCRNWFHSLDTSVICLNTLLFMFYQKAKFWKPLMSSCPPQQHLCILRRKYLMRRCWGRMLRDTLGMQVPEK